MRSRPKPSRGAQSRRPGRGRLLPADYSTVAVDLNIVRTVISAIFRSSQSEKFSM